MSKLLTVDVESPQLESVHVPQAFVAVCIPALNEADAIGNVIKEAKRYADLVLVCDDGSTDNTSSVVRSSGAMVIRHSKPLGKGAALRTLFREVSKFNPDVVVTLDADGQHDPADIPKVLSPIIAGSADVVIGSRFDNGNEVPVHRVVGNALLNVLTNLTAKTTIHDTQSGFRAYSGQEIRRLSTSEKGMGIDSEILLDVVRTGGRVEERSIRVTYGGDTSTFNPFNHTLQVLTALVRSQGRYGKLPTRKLLWLSLLILPLIVAFSFEAVTRSVMPLDGAAVAFLGAICFVATFGLSRRTTSKSQALH